MEKQADAAATVRAAADAINFIIIKFKIYSYKGQVISMNKKAGMTPMMQQYLQIKEEYSDCILFFRLGDFYEMFFEDAVVASKVLEITLTGKDCGLEERAPMCGVPYHSVQGYIAKLIKNGFKVAICEQVEDPKEAKGIVKRDVIRVITPGTANLDAITADSSNNFLACVYLEKDYYGISFADVSTGEIFTTEGQNDIIESPFINTMASFKPTELLINDNGKIYVKDLANLRKKFEFFDSFIEEKNFDTENAREVIFSKFGRSNPEVADLRDKPFAMKSLGAMITYLNETQKVDLSHMSKIKFFDSTQYLSIDINSRRNLEITETMRDKTKRGSLLGVLDKTRTAMGARRLKAWLDRPLIDEKQINMRLDSVQELIKKADILEDMRDILSNVQDMERLISKVVYGSCNARDFVALKESIRILPGIKKYLKMCKSELLSNLADAVEVCTDIFLLIDSAIVDEPPVTVKEGGMIRKEFNKQRDRFQDMLDNSTGYIARIEAAERDKTDIKNLKIKYNKVFGYYIEVSKGQLEKVPETYIRKQTLVNGERYITEELKELETNILTARERVNALEYADFCMIREKILGMMEHLQNNAKIISICDALCSLAFVASRNGYTRPVVDNSDVVSIEDGRHPIVEKNLSDAFFVPNDSYLDTRDNRFAIITGPNMAGKSTYMRQTALVVLMAQMGSFVPAKKCRVGVCDAIFTRVGASDDLSSGQSTFMVEMNEVAHILKNATSKSLIILDEIGRGTSTFDGLSIAWAVAEYICNSEKIGAKTLFATHYHELTQLEGKTDGIRNYSIAVKKRGDDITFLRKIVKGGTDDSFGIEVAKLAGVPGEVTERAKAVLSSLERSSEGGKSEIVVNPVEKSQQETVMTDELTQIIEKLKNTDVSTLTPIEALNELYNIQKKVSELI